MKKTTIIFLSLFTLASAASAQSKATKQPTINPTTAMSPTHPMTVNPLPSATQKSSNVKQGTATAHVDKGIPDNDQRLKK